TPRMIRDGPSSCPWGPFSRLPVVLPGAGGGRLGSEQGAVGVSLDADVQAEHSRAVQLGGAVVIVVLGREGGERELAIRAVEKEGVAQGGGRFDAGERVGDVMGDRGFIHRSQLLTTRPR